MTKIEKMLIELQFSNVDYLRFLQFIQYWHILTKEKAD